MRGTEVHSLRTTTSSNGSKPTTGSSTAQSWPEEIQRVTKRISLFFLPSLHCFTHIFLAQNDSNKLE